MNATGITSKDFETDKGVIVTPMAVFGVGDFSTIFITDAAGRGLWLDCDLDWCIDAEEGNINDAERIDGIFGADEEEWEASANEKLADYGFRLGDLDGDRYSLIAL
ncbi:MAG: hypothetical protein [Namikivirus tsukuho]|uniref:Uncharacterized protein n=1 Tax=Bacteriophage sp. TaxID=38018 RepID=A0ABY5TUP1_9VIRU|nr:MAG: hypothetical protein [Bacteriophage sp.]